MNEKYSPYQAVIVGCGNIGGGFDMDRPATAWPLSHAGAYARHTGFRIRACVDPDETRRRAFADRWGIGLHEAAIGALGPNLGPIAVVSICSPTALHHQHVIQAIELQPKVIFCEKPLTADIDTSVAVVEACKKRGIELVVNFSRQWDPSIESVISQLHEGNWGTIRSIVGHYNKGILNNGSHMIDLLLRLVGDLELVNTACSTLDFWDRDPTTAALLTAKGGTVPVYLNPGHASDYAFFEMEIVCEKGVIRMCSSGSNWDFREVQASTDFIGYRTLKQAVLKPGKHTESIARAIDELYKFLNDGAPIRSTGETALRIQTLCVEIQQSALAQCVPNH